jgi:hypothetical protein
VAKKVKKKLSPMAQWGHLINDERVYTGPAFEYPPKNFPQDVYYKVKGHPYWVVDYSNDITAMTEGLDEGRVRGSSTGTADLKQAKYSEPYRDNEYIGASRAKKGKYKNVDINGPFRRVLKSLPGVAGLLAAGALIPEEVRASPLSQEGLQYGLEATTGIRPAGLVNDPRTYSPWGFGAARDTVSGLGQLLTGGPPEVRANARGIPSGRFGPTRRGLLDTEKPRKRRTNIWT